MGDSTEKSSRPIVSIRHSTLQVLDPHGSRLAALTHSSSLHGRSQVHYIVEMIYWMKNEGFAFVLQKNASTQLLE